MRDIPGPRYSSREYMERRTHAPLDPPPSPDEIRRQLGWDLVPASRQPDQSVSD